MCSFADPTLCTMRMVPVDARPNKRHQTNVTARNYEVESPHNNRNDNNNHQRRRRRLTVRKLLLFHRDSIRLSTTNATSCPEENAGLTRPLLVSGLRITFVFAFVSEMTVGKSHVFPPFTRGHV